MSYSQLAQARSFGSDWGQALICIETALLLARPILAGEIFGGERLDLIRRQQTILAIDTCLREVFGVWRTDWSLLSLNLRSPQRHVSGT